MSRRGYVVEHAATRGFKDYYRVSAGKSGGDMVTVRVGREGVFACMTCHVVTCEHVRAAEEFAHDQRPGTTPAAA